MVRDLYAERRSGILHVSRQKIRRRIHFKKGVAVFADSGDGQLQAREQGELLAYSLFTWTSGEYEFEDGEPNIAESLAFQGSPSTLILEGIRRIDELEILERLIGGHDSVFASTQTSVLPLFKMRLSPAENAILTFAREREQFTTEDLPLPSSDVPVVNALNALVAVGLLEIVKKPPEKAPTPEPLVEAEIAPEPVPVTPVPPPVPAPTPRPPPVAQAPIEQPTSAPTQPLAPLMPPVPSEMEQLFDTLESKRSQIHQPKPAATAPAAPLRTSTPPPPPAAETPVIEAEVARAEPQVVAAAPEPTPPTQPVIQNAPPSVEDAPPIVETAPPPSVPPSPTPAPVAAAPTPAPAPAYVPPPAHAPPPQQAPASPPPYSPPRPSLMAVVSGWKDAISELLPTGKARLVVGGMVALIAVIVALVLMLASGNDRETQSDAVVAADSTPDVEATPPKQSLPPPAPIRDPEPDPDPEPVPSEAELFYRANLAFERGDFEQSQAELETLLELEPDLAAARELMARVERELEPAPEPPKPKRAPRRVVKEPPPPKPETKPEPPKPTGPVPSELYADARAALNRGELEASQVMLDQLNALNASYPGAQQLQEDLSERFWLRTLPLAFSSRHDHALGGCDGVLTLTSRGFGYRSKDHDWFWSFDEVAETDRKDSRQMRIETTKGQSYNFELRDPLVSKDWTRYRKLMSR